MRIISCALILLAVPALFGCSSPPDAPKPLTVSEVTVPAGMGSEMPNLSVTPDGRVFLTWLEPATTDGYRLMFSVRDDKGTWSEAKMVAEGDKVAARFTMRGTHQGAFFGVPPTGKKIEVAAMNFYRLSEGQFVEERGQPDLLGLLQQIGAVPT